MGQAGFRLRLLGASGIPALPGLNLLPWRGTAPSSGLLHGVLASGLRAVASHSRDLEGFGKREGADWGPGVFDLSVLSHGAALGLLLTTLLTLSFSPRSSRTLAVNQDHPGLPGLCAHVPELLRVSLLSACKEENGPLPGLPTPPRPPPTPCREGPVPG